MNNLARQFFFRWYWVLALVLSAIAVVVLFAQHVEKRWEVSAATAGIAVGLVYFVQKQKLEEINLFQRFFTEFNNRYSQLHARLQAISCLPATVPLGAEQLEVLDQYFNLCAEEYLFWEQGRILPCVWQSWCRGMLFYLQCPQVDRAWQNQRTLESHYGLSIQLIERGAGHHRVMKSE